MDKDAFIFSLDKMKIYENIEGEKAIGCYPKFGPVFLGCQIRIYDKAFHKGGTTYEKGLNYKTDEDFELNDGERLFNVKDIEVYEVIPQWDIYYRFIYLIFGNNLLLILENNY